MSKAGVYTVDITPPLGIDFIGYQRDGGMQSVLDRIYATAFVFEKQDKKAVLISVDHIGLLTEDLTQLRVRLAEEMKIRTENITVVCTHTHSGPDTEGNIPVQRKYKKDLFENLYQAAIHANNHLQPCEIGWGVANAEIGVNRRQIRNGKAYMETNFEGKVDRRIGVLGIKNKNTKEMSGLIVICTAHPNVLKGDSFALSGDYPGITRGMLAESLGCSVAVIQGSSGNVNARWRGTEDDLAQMAQAICGPVLSLLSKMEYRQIEHIVSVSRHLSMKLKRIPEPKGINKMAMTAEKDWGVRSTRWKEEIHKKYRENQREIELDLEVQLFQLNEGFFAGIPMEPFSETALEISEKLDIDFAFLGGCVNGYLGYLPNREAYSYGGYEVEVNPVIYGPETGLWMPPSEHTAEEVVKTVLSLYWGND